ncbi:hypothetical protein AB0M69_28165, partial [Streptomyces syringium]
VGERTVRVSHPEKVYFPQRGFTKADLARYYLRPDRAQLDAAFAAMSVRWWEPSSRIRETSS